MLCVQLKLLKNFFSGATKDALKTASERAIQEKAGATGDLIHNKIADTAAKSYNNNKITKTASRNAP